MNGKNPLTLKFITFTESTGLHYAKDAYVSHPFPEVVKAELANIVENLILLDMTPILETAFLVAWRIMFTCVVQVLCGKYSSTEQVNSIKQLFAYCLHTRTKRKKPKSKNPSTKTKVAPPLKPTEGSEQSYSVSSGTVPDPQDLKRNIQLAGTRLPSSLNKGTHKSQHLPKGTGAEYQVDKTQSTRLRKLVKYLRKVSRVLFKKLTKEQWTQHEEVVVFYADLRASIEEYYENNVDHREQTDKVIDATMKYLDKNNVVRGDLLNALNGVTETLKAMARKCWGRMSLMMPTEEPLSHTEGETEDMEIENQEEKPEEPEMAVPVSSVKPMETPIPEAQPITIIIPFQAKSSQAPKRVDKGKRIATDDVEPQVKLVPVSRMVREDPDKYVRVPDMINGKMHYLINNEITKHLKKEELIKKAAEQARLLAITKPEVVKVFWEKAKKIRIDPKRITSAKEGKRFKKAQDAELKIHLHTKHVVVTVDRGIDKRNFKVHNPFAFGAFGITKLDELREIIPKKKNILVKDLMNSLSRRKRKQMELEPEVKVPGLDRDRILPKGVLFVNNMVIKEPEYGIFFTDVFGDQAFQRLNGIHKVGVDSLVSYLVMASTIKTQENARVDVPMTQSQPIESTKGTHRTLRAPRTPNPATTQGESSAPRKLIVIQFHVRSQPDPKTPIPTSDEIDVTNLEEATQEIETMVEGTKNFDAFMDEIFNDQEEPDTRTHTAPLSSDKENRQELTASNPAPSSSTPTTSIQKPKQDHFKHYKNAVKSTIKKLVPSMVDKRFNKIAKKLVLLYVDKGLLLDRKKAQTDIVALVAKAVKKERENLRAELFMQAASSLIHDLQYQLYLKMKYDEQARNVYLSIWWSLEIKFEKLAPPVAPCRLADVRTRDHKEYHDDDALPEGESSTNRHKTSEHGTYIVGKSSSEQVMDESNPSGSGTHEQLDEFKAKMDDFGTNDDEVLSKDVSPELLEEISREVDEVLLQKDVNNMLRVRCNSGEEHQTKEVCSIVAQVSSNTVPENNLEELTSRWGFKVSRKMNKDVKHGYADPKLGDNDAEYLRFYKEYIKDQLRHQDQMRR
uniref:Uncharacterized protein n=1 Tax=Tanacetum cinerariifolium TaxID=118510 RepID=A0A6L2J4B8_TANCI|nr:hypothetical protein [Tanacetum cinerariifolium]